MVHTRPETNCVTCGEYLSAPRGARFCCFRQECPSTMGPAWSGVCCMTEQSYKRSSITAYFKSGGKRFLYHKNSFSEQRLPEDASPLKNKKLTTTTIRLGPSASRAAPGIPATFLLKAGECFFCCHQPKDRNRMGLVLF